MSDIINKIILIVSIVVGISFLFAIPVFYLWNGCLVGAIDGVKEITLLQAWGINILTGIFFRTSVETKK